MGRTKPIISKDYIVGLTDGEGCFYVNVGNMPSYRSGVRIQLHFYIKMQEKDKPLLEGVRDILRCGAVYFQKEKRKNHCQCYRYTVSSQRDILKYIIPFFEKNPLQSASKQKSFKAFCMIAKKVNDKKHLTKKGIQEIKQLKSMMNQRIIGLA